MHPLDLAPRNIPEGNQVRVSNERGIMLVRVRVSESTPAGVMWISHGWWASKMPGKASANVLTPDGLGDLGRSGDFYDARAQAAYPFSRRQRMLIRAVSSARCDWIPHNYAATRNCDTVLVFLVMCSHLRKRGRH